MIKTLHSHINCTFKRGYQRSTVKAANRKLISFMSFENITFIYRAFRVWAWPLLHKRSTSSKYVLGLTDSIYKLFTWCDDHVVLVNNPIVFRSHLIFKKCKGIIKLKLKIMLMYVLNSDCRSWKVLWSCMDSFVDCLNHV